MDRLYRQAESVGSYTMETVSWLFYSIYERYNILTLPGKPETSWECSVTGDRKRSHSCLSASPMVSPTVCVCLHVCVCGVCLVWICICFTCVYAVCVYVCFIYVCVYLFKDMYCLRTLAFVYICVYMPMWYVYTVYSVCITHGYAACVSVHVVCIFVYSQACMSGHVCTFLFICIRVYMYVYEWGTLYFYVLYVLCMCLHVCIVCVYVWVVYVYKWHVCHMYTFMFVCVYMYARWVIGGYYVYILFKVFS